jgi:predicted nucleotidyltransferase
MQSNLPFDMSPLIPICHQYDVAKLSVFGSVARGEATAESDIDLLIYYYKRKTLLTTIKLQREMSAILQRRVDLLTEAALSPYLRERILKEAQVIYEAT